MTSCRPLFYKLPHEYTAAKAYLLATNTEEGPQLETYYTYEQGIPATVFNEIDLRYRISDALTADEIENLKAQVLPLIREIFENSEIMDGRRRWTEELRDIDINIEHMCDRFMTDTTEACTNDDCAYCSISP